MDPSHRIRATSSLSWRCWDDGVVVFNPVSGYTHFLDVVAGEVLALLSENAMMAEQIQDRLAARLQIELSADLGRYTDQLLRQFDELGIIEPDCG